MRLFAVFWSIRLEPESIIRMEAVSGCSMMRKGSVSNMCCRRLICAASVSGKMEIIMKKLFKAIRQNDLESVIKILEKNPEVINCMATPPPKKDDGQSPLQVSIKTGNLTIAQYLIEKGADVNHMEPDNGLPPTQTYRCPVLFDAIMGLFARWENRRGDYFQVVSKLLEVGANPNKQDNRGNDSWDLTLNTYSFNISRLRDGASTDTFTDMTRELLDILIKHNADILNLDRIKKDLNQFETYSLVLENLILNRDDFYDVAPEQVEAWNRNCIPIFKIARPYYAKNNPYYEQKVAKRKKPHEEDELQIKKWSLEEESIAEKLIEAITSDNVGLVVDILKQAPQCVDYVLEKSTKFEGYNGQSIFQIAVNCASNTAILHILIASGVNVNYMPERKFKVPEGGRITYCDGKPLFYEYQSEIVYFPKNKPLELDSIEEPIIQSVLKRIITTAGLGGVEYADALVGVAVHLLDKGANPNKKDEGGYNSWLKLLCIAQRIFRIVLDKGNEELFLAYLEKCLRLLIEYQTDIYDVSIEHMDTIEDIILNWQSGHEPLDGLSEQQKEFWRGTGHSLCLLVEKFYYTDYDCIIGKEAKQIHEILGDKRHLMMTEFIERMEQGDIELIKQIAELFRQDDTPEGREKAERLLKLF